MRKLMYLLLSSNKNMVFFIINIFIILNVHYKEDHIKLHTASSCFLNFIVHINLHILFLAINIITDSI